MRFGAERLTGLSVLPIHTLKVGSLGTLHALGLVNDKKARFVLASTSETYGDPLEHTRSRRHIRATSIQWARVAFTTRLSGSPRH